MSRGRSRSRGSETDDRLVELVRAGDERAFELIVRRYARPLRGTCRRLGLSASRAEDAVQQTFLSAWLALRRGDEVRELGAWLRRIAHNKAVNMLRGPAEADSAAIEAAGAAELGGAERPATTHVEERMALRQALSDIAALPPMQRDALLMSAVDGRSYDEVARVLGVSRGAVRGLVHRARATLRDAAAAVAGLPLLRWLAWGRGPTAGQALGLAGATGTDGGTGAGIMRVIATAAGTLALLAGVTAGPLHHLLGAGRHSHGSSHGSSGGSGHRAASGSGAAGTGFSASLRGAGSGSVTSVSDGAGGAGSSRLQSSSRGGRSLAGSPSQTGVNSPSRGQGRSHTSVPRTVYTPSEGDGEASVPAPVGTAASSTPPPAATAVTAPVESPPTETSPEPVETAPKQSPAEDPTDDPPGSEHEKEPALGEPRTPEKTTDR